MAWDISLSRSAPRIDDRLPAVRARREREREALRARSPPPRRRLAASPRLARAVDELDEIAKRVMAWHYGRQRRLLKEAAGAYACAPMAKLPVAHQVGLAQQLQLPYERVARVLDDRWQEARRTFSERSSEHGMHRCMSHS